MRHRHRPAQTGLPAASPLAPGIVAGRARSVARVAANEAGEKAGEGARAVGPSGVGTTVRRVRAGEFGLVGMPRVVGGTHRYLALRLDLDLEVRVVRGAVQRLVVGRHGPADGRAGEASAANVGGQPYAAGQHRAEATDYRQESQESTHGVEPTPGRGQAGHADVNSANTCR